jgi:hypothetical protein
MSLVIEEQGCAEKLAKFFPLLPALRILVKVRSLQSGRAKLQESTVVEFGARQFAIFVTTLPLEFDERVQLVRDGNGRPAEAAVIALQYQEGRKAVAVQFLEGSCDWMMQP